MNKTININLGGSFFHIDEQAYHILKRYLDAVRASLSDDPKGRDEILSDIELRIGELLSEKVKDIRQVVNENDINEIIEIMGKPEDYMVDDDVFADDVHEERRRPKKMYRDSEDKFLGGVSSGMAYYFNIDVIWIRIIWLIAAFGFGFGFVVYIILWILLPEARTTSEKLEMRGEAVNISNIERKIKEELGTASEKIKNGITDVSDKVKNADYKKYSTKAKTGMQDILDVLGQIISTMFMIFGKFIGILLIIISVAVILGLVISLFTVGSLGFVNEEWFYQNTMIYNNSGLPIWGVSIIAFLLVGIPFFMLFLLGMKILSPDARIMGKTGKLSLFGIWLVALLFTIYFGVQQAMQSAYDGAVIENVELPVEQIGDTLNIRMIDNIKLSDNSELKRRWGTSLVVDDNNEEKIYSNNINLNIHQSNNEKLLIKVRKSSKGKSRELARENASGIDYTSQINDNDVILDGYFLTDPKSELLSRKDYVKVDLYLPVGKVIYLDRSLRSFLYDVKNIQNVYDSDMVKHYYRITEEGLDCLDCETMVEDIENAEKDKDPESFNMKIDEDGVHIKVVNDRNEKAEVKVDQNGVKIESTKDSLKVNISND
jgi:phage shock protein PspC (stress-responsive transcriptional regulator)